MCTFYSASKARGQKIHYHLSGAHERGGETGLKVDEVHSRYWRGESVVFTSPLSPHNCLKVLLIICSASDHWEYSFALRCLMIHLSKWVNEKRERQSTSRVKDMKWYKRQIYNRNFLKSFTWSIFASLSEFITLKSASSLNAATIRSFQHLWQVF